MVDWQRVRETDRSTFKDLALDFRTFERLKMAEAALTDASIQTKRYFVPLHTMPAYERFATPGAYPVTEDLHNRLLCVPLFGDLTSDDVDSICDLVVAAVGS